MESFRIPAVVDAYYRSGAPSCRKLGVQPWLCEFGPVVELEQLNHHDVPQGYFAFATNGAGEVFALALDGSVVVLDACGLDPDEALLVAPTWDDFVSLLGPAP